MAEAGALRPGAAAAAGAGSRLPERLSPPQRRPAAAQMLSKRSVVSCKPQQMQSVLHLAEMRDLFKEEGQKNSLRPAPTRNRALAHSCMWGMEMARMHITFPSRTRQLHIKELMHVKEASKADCTS